MVKMIALMEAMRQVAVSLCQFSNYLVGTLCCTPNYALQCFLCAKIVQIKLVHTFDHYLIIMGSC